MLPKVRINVLILSSLFKLIGYYLISELTQKDQKRSVNQVVVVKRSNSDDQQRGGLAPRQWHILMMLLSVVQVES